LHFIRSIFVGKSHRLFPTFFSTLTAVSPTLASQWNESLYNLMGFPQIQTITYTDLYSGEHSITATIGFDDVYRKKINQKTTLTIAEQSNGLLFRLPFHVGNTRQLIAGELAHDFSYFNNLSDQTSFVSRCRVANTHLSAGWAITRGAGHLGCSADFSQSATPLTINIKSFPQSADYLTDEFFFDLLVPTFGRELTGKVQTQNSGFNIWAGHRLSKLYLVAVSMRYTDFKATWRCRYTNTGSKASLAGQRQIDIPIDGIDKTARFSLLSTKSVLKDLSVTVFQDKFTYYIDNNRPVTTDFESLGDGNFNRSGATLSGRLTQRSWEFTGGLSGARYDFEAFLRTPVLGYYAIFLPISHSAAVKFSRGQSFSQQIGFDKNLIFRNFKFLAGGQYTHTLYDFWIEGTADLMLGIESTPLDYPLKYSLSLFDFHAEAIWQKGPFALKYIFRQMIPFGRRLDNSPIHLVERTAGYEYANRGGQQHQFNFSVYF